MVQTRNDRSAGALVVAAVWVAGFLSPEVNAEQTVPALSPALSIEHPSRVLWGDTHLHTMNSIDAASMANRLGPEVAYRFAKGEEVVSNSGLRARLERPLDFLVVSDHSDNMGFFYRLLNGDPDVLANARGKEWSEALRAGGEAATEASYEILYSFNSTDFPSEIASAPGTLAYRSAWQTLTAAAEAANEPGRFTALIGYEWTSMPGDNNMHRNVIYRDGADRANQLEPFTVTPPAGSADPRELWKWMARYEANTGGQVLAIPHNGNTSNGFMFAVDDPFTGESLDAEYYSARARWEPLYEVTQIKGDGETHPALSPEDEFADYGTWDWGNLTFTTPKQDGMIEYEYARQALARGLALAERLGPNPYKFGMIGSTDSHTSLATADENNYYGKFAHNEPEATRILKPFAKGKAGMILESWELLASGYAAVWAQENTREALFDAMLRKEVYATTGPRITVRFFGGWSFESKDATAPDLASVGYAKGVPMGGDLPPVDQPDAPRFLVAASRDPIGANLDRIQIVKSWLSSDGETQERVYDVAWSDAREPDSLGKVPPVGNTVDVSLARFSNRIGASELSVVWVDPDFDASSRAVYYARVLEIPTPTWSAYDAALYGTEAPEGTLLTHQDRAYTSPIWYTPAH